MSASIRDSWSWSWDRDPVDTQSTPANALSRIRRTGWSREFPRRGQNPFAKLCNFRNRKKVRRTHEIVSRAVGQRPVTREPQRTLVQRSRDQRPTRERKSEALFRGRSVWRHGGRCAKNPPAHARCESAGRCWEIFAEKSGCAAAAIFAETTPAW